MSNLQKVYLTNSGRIARLPYLGYGLLLAFLYLIAAAVLVTVLGPIPGLIVAILLYLALVFPFYNLMAKRLQDFNKPGKWAWGVIALGVLGSLMQLSDSMASVASLLGLLQGLLALLILILPGTLGDNDYGPQPA